MRVQFKTNLGSVAASKLGVDFKRCVYGAEVEFSEETGKTLCDMGAAFALAEKPVKLEAVPPKPEVVSVVAAEPEAPVVASKKPKDK